MVASIRSALIGLSPKGILREASARRAQIARKTSQAQTESTRSAACRVASDIQILRKCRALLDEAEAGLGLGAHEGVDGLGGLAPVAGDVDPEQRAPSRVHGGLLELGGVHLAEPLEAAHVHLGVVGELALDEPLLVLLVARVDRLGAVGELEERRHRQEQVLVLDQLRHLLVEEGDQQRGDVGAVDVGVRHDDDALVAQVLVAVFAAGAARPGPAPGRTAAGWPPSSARRRWRR